jgi:branched-subunit amino acid transport protein
MGVVTFLPRVIPMLVLPSSRLPPLVRTWLKILPVAVMAALVLSSLVPNHGDSPADPVGLTAFASLATLLVARKTRSLLGSVVVGVGIVALARLAESML